MFAKVNSSEMCFCCLFRVMKKVCEGVELCRNGSSPWIVNTEKLLCILLCALHTPNMTLKLRREWLSLASSSAPWTETVQHRAQLTDVKTAVLTTVCLQSILAIILCIDLFTHTWYTVCFLKPLVYSYLKWNMIYKSYRILGDTNYIQCFFSLPCSAIFFTPYIRLSHNLWTVPMNFLWN